MKKREIKNSLRKRILGLLGIVVVLTALTVATASATSSNVVVIPHTSGDYSGSGTLPTGAPDFFPAFTFTNMAPSAVNSISLAPFDTAVLYLSASGLNCNSNNLPAGAKAALNAFVAAGGKLIIYDAECTSGGAGVDYTWVTFPFQTKNPGAQGAFGGNLTIVEQNILSTSTPGDPNFINTTNITSQTDAVGDMNVVNLTTVDPNWCLDMTGTNVNGNQGAVHMYAKSGTGLYIYNGLDLDYLLSAVGPTGGGQLTKIWKQELNSTASLFTCGISVVGITLTPVNATNPVGTTHTVTAALTNLTGVPQPNVSVIFSIISGPNSPFNASGTTNVSGAASFTYTGTGGVGTDTIIACFTNQAGQGVCSQNVTKEWTNQIITPKGSISGMKFNDTNHNSTKDAGETGLAGWNITLTNESGGVVINITDASGNYNFTNLTDGNYTVGEVIQPGWVETMPGISLTGSVTYNVEIKGGNQVTDKDFGNFFDIPSASCVKGPNPSDNIPPAKGGQRPDGFYQLLGTDIFDPSPQIFVTDTGSGTIFPSSPPGFANGTNIKYTQAPGATPSIEPFSGVVAWHITGTGDAAVYAVNSVGNPSPSVSCLVPPPPK